MQKQLIAMLLIIASLALGGWRVTKVTSSSEPVWRGLLQISPNRKYLAYIPTNLNFDKKINYLDLTTWQDNRITSITTHTCIKPSWSADSKAIVFHSKATPVDIWEIFNLDSNTIKPFMENNTCVMSPDTNLMAYSGFNRNLFIKNLATQQIDSFFVSGNYLCSKFWVKNSKNLICVVDRYGTGLDKYSLYLINIATKSLKLICNLPQEPYYGGEAQVSQLDAIYQNGNTKIIFAKGIQDCDSLFMYSSEYDSIKCVYYDKRIPEPPSGFTTHTYRSPRFSQGGNAVVFEKAHPLYFSGEDNRVVYFRLKNDSIEGYSEFINPITEVFTQGMQPEFLDSNRILFVGASYGSLPQEIYLATRKDSVNIQAIPLVNKDINLTAYPNPFNNLSVIHYELENANFIQLSIYKTAKVKWLKT